MTPHQVSVAGEALAASMFAHAGFDVLVQYGANQPGYDFVARKGTRALCISVKATQTAGWGLIQNYKEERTYHEAADAWLADQSPGVIFALVTFHDVAPGDAGRCYIATPAEIAAHHKTARRGAGHTTLYENYTPSRGVGAGDPYRIPATWKFNKARIDGLFAATTGT